MFKRLLELANQLDKKGFYEEANEIDILIKESGWWDNMKQKMTGKAPTCNCTCEKCQGVKSKLEEYGIGPGMSGYISIISGHCKNHGTGCQYGS